MEPILLIHGTADTSVSPGNMEILYKNAPKELTESLLLPGFGHSGIYSETEYAFRVIPFITKNLIKDNAIARR